MWGYLVLPYFKKKDFIYLLLENGEGREKERERNIDVREKRPLTTSLICALKGTQPTTLACAQTRNQMGDPLLCGMTPNQLRHTGLGYLLTFDTTRCSRLILYNSCSNPKIGHFFKIQTHTQLTLQECELLLYMHILYIRHYILYIICYIISMVREKLWWDLVFAKQL